MKPQELIRLMKIAENLNPPFMDFDGQARKCGGA